MQENGAISAWQWWLGEWLLGERRFADAAHERHSCSARIASTDSLLDHAARFGLYREKAAIIQRISSISHADRVGKTKRIARCTLSREPR